MIDLRIHIWDSSAVVLAEETPGRWRRLTGDPFGDDGSMPLIVSVLGREVYVGTSAVAVAYENARAEVQVLTGADGAMTSRTLTAAITGIVRAVERRYLQEELRWTIVTDDGYGWSDLAIACWHAGIPDARVRDVSGIQTAHALAPGTGLGQSVMISLLKSGRPSVQLAVSTNKGWIVVDDHREQEKRQDPYQFTGGLYGQIPCGGSSLTSGGARKALLLDNSLKAILCDPAARPPAVALMEHGKWCLQALPVAEIASQEVAYWRALAQTCASYRRMLGDYAVDRCLVFESGQRAFAKRFEITARRIFEEELALCVEGQCVDAWSGGTEGVALELDAEYALCLVGDQGPLVDYKSFASKGAVLPFHSEQVLYLQHTVQRSMRLQISKLDSLADRPYPLAATEVELLTDMKKNTAVRLGITLRRTGVLEVKIAIPAYQFNEDLLFAPNGARLSSRDSAACVDELNF